jgi:replication fork protection complex subunit Tof1/Swi1
MDVARCIAEANLVDGDLLQILATWPENAAENRFKARIALACFEVIVPLTWPLDRDPEKMTVNHHRHIPVLQLAQLGYKRAIINFDGARILHSAARVALPAMAMPIGERTPRDQGVIKLMLFFLRNIAQIAPPPGIAFDGDESQVSRAATIDAFSYQDIFLVLLTIASNMGEDFRTEDVILMEVIFHLVKRVDVQKLFMNEQQLHTAKAHELTSLMNKENAMIKSYNRKGPTRHNRFGTMIWVKRDDGKMSSISGQDALTDAAARQQKMDNSKTFRPPRRPRRKDDMEPKDLGTPPKMNARANDQLRSFVVEFLDSGFNPLFQHVRKSIDREAPHVLQHHKRQFFYLVGWFLEAERTRRKFSKGNSGSTTENGQPVSSFNLVAGVLDQNMFITLNRSMHDSWEQKDWSGLSAAMRCFNQILLTVQEMWESTNEEDQEIAENTLSRLFYHDATHDLIVNVVRQYKDQGFDYLDAATELIHNFLRILEAYSKQNVDMQVQSRRRVRQKRKAARAAGADVEEDENDNSDNDEQHAERDSKERKFNFGRFLHRFTPQAIVDAFAAFTKFYRDLDDAQLKRSHRYFYRLAFKQEMAVMLFRADIIHLLYNMIKGPEPLDKGSCMYKEWEELVKQILRKCIRKIEERPGLLVEMLFSKINSTVFFLEHGYENMTSTSKPKPAAELEFRHAEGKAEQIAIVVGALLDKNQDDHIQWVKRELVKAERERRAWAVADQVIPSMEQQEGPEGEEPTPALAPTTSQAPNISKS